MVTACFLKHKVSFLLRTTHSQHCRWILKDAVLSCVEENTEVHSMVLGEDRLELKAPYVFPHQHTRQRTGDRSRSRTGASSKL